ncbi:MAG: hypothetical protein M1365_01505 [Actinobacteria bacterium]|nr:hypothetical protein [Actinomycetota bacterium]
MIERDRARRKRKLGHPRLPGEYPKEPKKSWKPLQLWKRPEPPTDPDSIALNPESLRDISDNPEKAEKLLGFAQRILDREKLPERDLEIKRQQVLSLLRGEVLPKQDVPYSTVLKARRILTEFKRYR